MQNLQKMKYLFVVRMQFILIIVFCITTLWPLNLTKSLAFIQRTVKYFNYTIFCLCFRSQTFTISERVQSVEWVPMSFWKYLLHCVFTKCSKTPKFWLRAIFFYFRIFLTIRSAAFIGYAKPVVPRGTKIVNISRSDFPMKLTMLSKFS